MGMVAALFVETNGVYFGLPNVDAWDEQRDARLYAGPWPVVAHPPCERWGRFSTGGPHWLSKGNPPKRTGDDGGRFHAALAAVRKWGGVLEHPADSKGITYAGMIPPKRAGGWTAAGDQHGGWLCCVDQGHYGHRASKATWLYAVGCQLPSLTWGPAVPQRKGTTRRTGSVAMLCRAERRRTPWNFASMLLCLAASATGFAAATSTPTDPPRDAPKEEMP